MATLVLGAVGAVVGGPIGAVIGSAVGSRIDRALFAPDPEPLEGPRLADARVQSSALGATIPLVFGTARVAGNVIWSSGLVETRTETKQKTGGKGGSKKTTTVEFSYSVSAAVAVSGRPILGIGRIWADGKLLRDSAGNLLAPVTIRVHDGREDQAVDPLIEAAEGSHRTPPFRGLAYVVLEDLELAEFANRLPNLSFEVIAETAPAIGDVAAAIAGRAGIATIADGVSDRLDGLVVAREADARRALESLLHVFPTAVSEGGGIVRLAALDASPGLAAAQADLGAGPAGGERVPRLMLERMQGSDLPLELSLGYGDPARDYQPSVQRARRQLGHTDRRLRVDSPLVLSADRALQQADRLLARVWQRQERYRLQLPIDFSVLEPGDRLDVTIEGRQIGLLVEELEIHPLHVALSGVPLESIPALADETAETGDFPLPVVIPPGETTLHVLDLPGLFEQRSTPRLLAAAAGASPGWRGAGLFVSRDEGDSFDLLASTNAPAVIGTVSEPPAAGPIAFWDEAGTLRVALLRPEMELESRSTLAVLNGANRAVVGEEILQFREATLEADGSYVLRGLLRGRDGTEAAVAGHEAGERFVLLDGGGLVEIDVPIETVGQPALVKPVTTNRLLEETAEQTVAVAANGLRPLSPVHVRARRTDAGDLELSWIRRTRFAGAWRDGVDVPLNEDSERYEVDILSNGTPVRTLAVTEPAAVYDAAQQTADFGSPQADIDIAIYQTSTLVGRGAPWSGRV